ncbi:Retrovirus-related Pol poly from transposon [Paramuricea clavata]|uniref:Retrovirus-related Pol poly from transposon n=1 Tax=Paramuricea clavata TaxID=317549 RepID=A0A7D9ERM0_PARCT|nr:Retrovirus-related Pol poly from transposon [Paramuricea clavata]
MQYCEEGWPERQSIPDLLKSYWSERGETSVVKGVILKGSRILIPSSMKLDFLDKIHQGHLGITKCRERAKQSVWWPGISTQIQELIKNCRTCARYHVNKPLIPTAFPERPWQIVAVEFFKCENREYLLVASRLFLKKYVGHRDWYKQRRNGTTGDDRDKLTTKQHSIDLADTLSRHFIKGQPTKSTFEEEFDQVPLTAIINRIIATEEKISKLKVETEKDEVLQQVKGVIQAGWPGNKNVLDPTLVNYFHVRDDLTAQESVVLRDYLSTTTSNTAIKKLKGHFARYGIPDEVVSGNGPQYDSDEFQAFAKSFGFKHTRTSPHHPQSNKKVAPIIIWLFSTFETRRRKDIIQSSPAQRMMNRRTRTTLPTSKNLLKPRLTGNNGTNIAKKQAKQQHYYNRGAKTLAQLHEGDRFKFQPFGLGKKKWSDVKVIREVRPRSYEVEANDRIYIRNRKHRIYANAHQPRSWKSKKRHTYQCQIMVEKKITNRKGRNKREMKHNVPPAERELPETRNTGRAAGTYRKDQ